MQENSSILLTRQTMCITGIAFAVPDCFRPLLPPCQTQQRPEHRAQQADVLCHEHAVAAHAAKQRLGCDRLSACYVQIHPDTVSRTAAHGDCTYDSLGSKGQAMTEHEKCEVDMLAAMFALMLGSQEPDLFILHDSLIDGDHCILITHLLVTFSHFAPQAYIVVVWQLLHTLVQHQCLQPQA